MSLKRPSTSHWEPQADEAEPNSFGPAQALYRGAPTPFERRAPVVREAMFRPNDDKWGPVGIFNPEYKIKELGLGATPAKSNFNAIINGIAGSDFSDQERSRVGREIIDNISIDDAFIFNDVGPSKDGKLRVNRQQLGIIVKLINGFPKDNLGIKIRRSYNKALKDGRIILDSEPPRRK